MKKMKNLFLSILVLISSSTGLEAWVCIGCNQERQDNIERPMFLCYNQGHQYCLGCLINYQRSDVNTCPHCIARDPNGNNIHTVINAELQRNPRCYNCHNLFNTTNHFPINPNPCHHKICVSCAYPLLQNRGYTQRSVDAINRRNRPRYHNNGVNNVFIDRHGNRYEHQHRNIMHDQVIHQRTQAHHYISAECPVCNNGFAENTCNLIRNEYNNRALSFGQYIWHSFGSNNKERFTNFIVLGGVTALIIAAIYKDAQTKKQQQTRIITPPAPSTQQTKHHVQRRSHNYRRV